LPGELDGYNPTAAQLRLTNGSKIWGYSADRPDRLRGSNLPGAWIDEMATMVHLKQLWSEALMLALRIGERPRVFVTTTPRGAARPPRQWASWANAKPATAAAASEPGEVDRPPHALPDPDRLDRS
jgi:hypothetical protein